jgi:SAM-dependent methyltransferase
LNGEDCARHVAEVRRYWQETHRLYLESVGTTFQGGYLRTGETVTPKGSNLAMAAAAGIREGMRVLDAGCGVCGPAIHIAEEIANLEVVGITVSAEQAATGSNLVRQAGLQNSIRILQADFHDLPFARESFDLAYYFESSCYAYDPETVFREAFRVLRRGGGVYIKDLFRKDDPLSEQEREELAEMNRTYLLRTCTITKTKAALSAAGFIGVRSRDLSSQTSTTHVLEAMFRLKDGYLEPTGFGKRHFRPYATQPVYMGEVQARRPQ